MKTHHGSCHCKAVRFEVDVETLNVTRCNCSICTKLGTVGCVVAPGAFRLIAGEESLGAYEWGSKIAARRFCKTCGVHVFGKGHLDVLGGDFVSVNANCLDDVDVGLLETLHWDGRHDNWQAGARKTPWPIFG